MLNELKKRMKIIKTCNLYLCLFTLGLSVSLTGPCLLDLQHTVHTDTQHIAMIYTARSTGYLVGAIAGGILLDLVRSKQAVLTGCNFFVAASMFGIPWSRNVETLMGFMIVNGMSLGAIETGGNVICLHLWGKDSNPIFQGLHFTFGLGGLLSPLIAAPFLENIKDLVLTAENSTFSEEPVLENYTYSDKYLFENSTNFSINVTDTAGRIPKIVYPFSIVGAIALSVAVLYFATCVVSPTEDEGPSEGKVDSPDRNCCFMFFTVIFMFLIFFIVAGTEIAYAQMLTTYAVKGKLHTTTTVGSYITSVFWAAFTLGRLASVFLAIKISSIVLIIGDICVVSVSALILLFLTGHEWALWLASVVFGVGIASGYASLVGWVGTHIKITNKISAIFTVGCAAGEMVMPFIIAYFIETIPEMFAFVVAASCILTVILLFTLHCIFKAGNRVRETKTVECFVIDTGEKQK